MMKKTMWPLLVAAVLAVAAPATAQDPSTTPLLSGSGAVAERYRIIADLDRDSRDDLILSDDIRTFGTSGGGWTVYLSRASAFVNVGTIDAQPLLVSIEIDHDAIRRQESTRIYARIWVYGRVAGSEGLLRYYRVGPSSVSEGGRLTIYPGDGGSALGNAVAEAVFTHSEIPFRLERSSTDANGNVTWHPYQR